MNFRTHILLVYLFFAAVLLSPLYGYNTVRQLTNLNGLSNNSINCIFQDSKGTMWFGTWDGLNSYDGRDFKAYRYSSGEYSISNNTIRQIEESDSSHLWIATDYGINRWDRKTQRFDNYFLDINTIKIKSEKSYLIALTTEGTVISFVNNYGFSFFDPISEEFKKIDGIDVKRDIKKIIIDSKDQLYILHSQGLLERYDINYNDNTVSVSGKVILQKSSLVLNMFYTNKSVILDYGKYIELLDNGNLYPASITLEGKNQISDIIFRRDHLILSYQTGGCDIYSLKSKTFAPLPNFSQNISIFSMYLGTQDILWIGTDGQGVFQIHQYTSSFGTVRTDYPVRTICQLSDEEILIGTKGGGIKTYNKQNNTLQNYANQDNGLISNFVYTMKKNAQGDIFIGTEAQGLNVISDGKLYQVPLPKNKPFFQSIYDLEFTNNDSCIWLGTSGFGLIKIELVKQGNRYKASSVRQYTSSNNENLKSEDIIYSVEKGDNDSTLWIGTRIGGVYNFDINTGIFTNLEDMNSNLFITNNDVLCMAKTPNSLWIGTSYGLNQLILNDPQKYDLLTYSENFEIDNNAIIHGILPQGDDRVWVSTNNGLYNVNLKDYDISHFSINDGLQNNEFSDGAYYADSAGIFYFGGVRGFNYFDPNDINLRDFVPSIALVNISILNTSYNVYDKIVNNTLDLDYKDSYIVTLRFISQDYIKNENCEYAYRLLNLSDEWINNGQNPNVVLTNLSPGKYKLQVKATNGDRIWSDNIYELSINVAYPWWLSKPAIIGYCILVLLIIYIIYAVTKNRIHLNRQLLLEYIEKENQKKLHESKLDFFTNVAHEFFTPLTLIYGPAQHLLEKSGIDSYTKRYIQVIKNNADRMQSLVNELMEFRKVESKHTPIYPEEIDVSLLIEYISDNYTEIAEQNKIMLQIETDNVSTFITDRNSIEKIIFNLLSNAFKYTPRNGYIHIKVSQASNLLTFKIRNSGDGLTKQQLSEIFDQFKVFKTPSKIQNARSTGIGLSLVKSLVDLLGGKITVDSEMLEFIEFNVELPPLSLAKGEKNEISDTDLVSMRTLAQERKDISILIVEDERTIRELLNDILEPYYNVQQAIDGEDAYSMIMQNTPDIIISDILMPNVDGIELLDRLKADTKTSHIPIINISAKTSLDDKINAYQHGANLYITKPFHPRHILATVQNIINRNTQLKNYFTSSLSSITVKDGLELHQEDENFLKEVISYIEQNIDDESLNPNTMADALGLSKATLYRKLKDLADKTPSEFVRNIRLNYAAQLLISTKYTVQEIMYNSGFTNKSYFYREFAKQYNTSPNEYRQKHTE